jgi:DUF1365 family protein
VSAATLVPARPRTRTRASCVYEGTIRHRRTAPQNEFRHRIALAYLDLDELPDLLGGRLLRGRPGTLRWRRTDYLGDPAIPLARAVGAEVERLGGRPCEGPVRVLTQLRSFGVCFNPVSFYYCFAPGGAELEQVLVEVTNTPWGERRAYLLADHHSGSRVLHGDFDKELHVSPFFGMDHRYHARATVPGDTLSVHIENEHRGATVFDATLRMHRRELSRACAARMTARHPAASAQVLALIYGHAVALRLKGAAIHPHPEAAS